MSELAELSQTSQASLTGVIDRLQDMGFAQRIRSEEDRRVVKVAITPAGRAEVQRVQTDIAECLKSLLEPLTIEESRELVRIFRKLNRRDQA